MLFRFVPTKNLRLPICLIGLGLLGTATLLFYTEESKVSDSSKATSTVTPQKHTRGTKRPMAAPMPSVRYKATKLLPKKPVEEQIHKDQRFSAEIAKRVKANPEAALKWYSTLSSAERADYLSMIVYWLAHTKPELAETMLQANPYSALDQESWLAIIQERSLREGSIPFKWAEEQVHPMNQAQALHAATYLWTLEDPVSAANWINTQEDGFLKDHITAGYASSIAKRDHTAAELWASAINEESLRAEVIQLIQSPKQQHQKR
jgi:hypothetical protein